ncbi:MAG: hypothetical protein GX442_23935 [Candidatus Riflebacteria bacterium]|nr:hypothetical protein [Candidatus Riflebacteria bacterium]
MKRFLVAANALCLLAAMAANALVPPRPASTGGPAGQALWQGSKQAPRVAFLGGKGVGPASWRSVPATPPSPDLIEALLSDPVLAAGLETVVFSIDGASVSSLDGTLSEPLAGDPVEAGRQFLLAHRALFHLPDWPGTDWLPLLRHDRAAGALHLAFGLAIGGLPVEGARIDLHLGSDRQLQMVTGSFPAVTGAPKAAAFTAAQAIGRAAAAVGVGRWRAAPRAGQVGRPGPDGIATVWRVDLPAADPLGDFRVEVDGVTGAVLGCQDRIAYRAAPGGDRETGQGSVFANHPLTGRPVLAPLPRLATHTLVGEFVRIRNDNGPTAVSLEDRYVFDPSDTHFDEVNAYHHLDRVHAFFAGLGDSTVCPVARAWVHYGTNVDNAFYSPFEDRIRFGDGSRFNDFAQEEAGIRFGDGSRFNDFAQEEAVIYHEYAHAVLHRIVALEYAGEAGAINEGQADYFAASLSGEPRIGEWVAAKAGLPFLRTLDNTLHYPEDCTNEVHDDGRIWGGALWDLRRALGPAVTDRLVHAGHFFLKPGEPWFRDGCTAILTADRNLFAGRHRPTITAVFAHRGIVPEAGPGAVLTGTDLAAMCRFRNLHRE